ncbi:MAG: hypothetical protein KDA96_11165, partial [Planctomycetaceae bacterium]|nr:hypothetical protein [Planctomycetaceae bacterium]
MSASTLASVVIPDGTVSARQDEAQPAAALSGVPRDMTQEAVEQINPAVAEKLGPALRTIFDSAESSESRQAAIAVARSAAGELSAEVPGAASMQRRILRRISLIEASIAAADVADLSAGGAEGSPVATAAAEAESWLNGVSGGAGWKDYLHLAELKGNAGVPVLRQVSANLAVKDSMSDEQRSFLDRPALAKLRSAVDGTLAAANYEGDEEKARTELRGIVNQLVVAALAYEDHQLATGAEGVRDAYRQLRSRFPAAADVMSPVLMNHYFNHNVHITVSEQLLSRLVSDFRSESGTIADCIMGAWVTGCQVTDVSVSADVRPSATSARFDLVANGNTRSNTTAQKSPATVFTQGNHYFRMVHPASFDGRQITGGHGSISVDANNTTTGIRTEYDGIPLIGDIVRNIAAKEVAKSRAESESLTASRISSEALPEFNKEVTTQLADINGSLSKLMDSLDRKGVAPDSISSRSSNTHLAVSSRTMGTARLGGSLQPASFLSATGMVVQVHESAMNNALDALGFQGRDIAEKDMVKELEAALSDLLQKDIKLTDGEPDAPAEGEQAEAPSIFKFSSTDPLRVHFDNNELVLTMRMGVAQEGKEEIPEQIIVV